MLLLKNIKYSLPVVFIVLLHLTVFSQDYSPPPAYGIKFIIGKQYEITLNNGSKVTGFVTEETSELLTLEDKTKQQWYEVNKNDIKTAKPVFDKNNLTGNTNYREPSTNTYLISENALPYEKRKLSYNSHYFLLNNFSYAFTENWSISTNVIIILPVSIGVKCSYKIGNNLYISANAFVYGFPRRDTLNGANEFILPFMGNMVRITKGNKFRNFTLGGSVNGVKEPDNGGVYTMRTHKYIPVYTALFAFTNQFSKSFSINFETRIFPQIFLNITGLSFKWIRGKADWNFGCYGMYLGKITQLNTNSQIIPLPYISYGWKF